MILNRTRHVNRSSGQGADVTSQHRTQHHVSPCPHLKIYYRVETPRIIRCDPHQHGGHRHCDRGSAYLQQSPAGLSSLSFSTSSRRASGREVSYLAMILTVCLCASLSSTFICLQSLQLSSAYSFSGSTLMQSASNLIINFRNRMERSVKTPYFYDIPPISCPLFHSFPYETGKSLGFRCTRTSG
jgi:hypothetical protein